MFWQKWLQQIKTIKWISRKNLTLINASFSHQNYIVGKSTKIICILTEASLWCDKGSSFLTKLDSDVETVDSLGDNQSKTFMYSHRQEVPLWAEDALPGRKLVKRKSKQEVCSLLRRKNLIVGDGKEVSAWCET